MANLTIVGGGLSGCEAAWQAAQRGISVTLYEMRPSTMTGAHQTSDLAEIICSNSFGSKMLDRPSGLLSRELEMLGSLLVDVAKSYSVPAGHALATDRNLFSKKITQIISSHPNIKIIHEEITTFPVNATIIASGPLTSPALSEAIMEATGFENLFFFDAIAPIIETESINMDIAFRASRYGNGSNEIGDYINCPFDKLSYEYFISNLINAERIELRNFEQDINSGVRVGIGKYFEACLPIEIMASRGLNTLAFGPLRPTGLTNPKTNQRPFAVVQLRQDDLNANLFNMVGFQTNLKYSAQDQVFRLIPGLEKASFERYGQMHRNTFINSPKVLDRFLQLVEHPEVAFCGQIIGVEGYLANIASGLMVGMNSARKLHGQDLITFPNTTMIGALIKHVTTTPQKEFQPMKANFGLLQPIEKIFRSKKEKHEAYSSRAISDMMRFLGENEI